MWRAYITTSEVYRRLLIFINPACDLGPRIAHALLPIPGKRDSDFAYGWIPVVGPIIGGIIGALLYAATFGSAPAPH
jgi:glycerol uptake facilitator-like aquaporin